MPGIEREWVAWEINELLVVEFYSPPRSDPRGPFHFQLPLLCFSSPRLLAGFLMGRGGCLPTAEMAILCQLVVSLPEGADAWALVEQTLIAGLRGWRRSRIQSGQQAECLHYG